MFPLSPLTQGGPLRPPSLFLVNLWSLLCLLIAVFFFMAASVQLNDPDPLLWIPAYLVPSGLSLYTSLHLRRTLRIVPLTLPLWIERLINFHLVYSFLLGLYTLTHFTLRREPALDLWLSRWTSEEMMEVEEGLELLGLCLLTLWLALLKDLNFLRVRKWGLLAGSLLAMGPLLYWVLLHESHC